MNDPSDETPNFIDYHSNGKQRWVGQKDEQGQKFGKWTYYSPDGTLGAEGQCNNNQMDGVWKLHVSPDDIRTVTYINGNVIDPETGQEMNGETYLIKLLYRTSVARQALQNTLDRIKDPENELNSQSLRRKVDLGPN